MTTAVTDFTQFNNLRTQAQTDPGDTAVLREVASQFEALFVQTLLKEMREASLGDPLFGSSNEHKTYTEMFDQQLATELASHQGFGIADALVRQLAGVEPATVNAGEVARGLPLPPRSTIPASGASAPAAKLDTASQAAVTPVTVPAATWGSPQEFVRDIWPDARRTAQRLGVPPEALVAQAALETGWGARVMRTASGANSFNLFGIKTGPDWSGSSVNKRTLEFENGVPIQVRDRFRAYSGVRQAFDDYARVLESRPRYVRVLNSSAAEFPQRIQEAGYATDPDYASKIEAVMQSPLLRSSLTGLSGRSSIPAAYNPAVATVTRR